jgi:hypothetical protein
MRSEKYFILLKLDNLGEHKEIKTCSTGRGNCSFPNLKAGSSLVSRRVISCECKFHSLNQSLRGYTTQDNCKVLNTIFFVEVILIKSKLNAI